MEKSGFSDEIRNLLLGSSDNINLPCPAFLCPDSLGEGCKCVPPTTHFPLLQHPSLAGVSGDDTQNTGDWTHTEVMSTGSGFQEQWICPASVSITWILDAEEGEEEAVK